MFQKGRLDLLENISRQQSKTAEKPELPSTSASSSRPPPVPATSEVRMEGTVDTISNGQKMSFYHLKDLERRVERGRKKGGG